MATAALEVPLCKLMTTAIGTPIGSHDDHASDSGVSDLLMGGCIVNIDIVNVEVKCCCPCHH